MSVKGEHTQYNFAKQAKFNQGVICFLIVKLLGNVTVQPFKDAVPTVQGRGLTSGRTQHRDAYLGQGLHQLKTSWFVDEAAQELAFTFKLQHSVRRSETLLIWVMKLYRHGCTGMRIDSTKYDRKGALASSALSRMGVAINYLDRIVAVVQRPCAAKGLNEGARIGCQGKVLLNPSDAKI